MKVEDTNALRFILHDDLYLLDEDKSHYASHPVSAPALETQQPVFNYLGSNKKNFLILVNYQLHDVIQGDHLAALEAVLTRKNYSREDVAILNLAKNGWTNNEALNAFFKPERVLILGKTSIPPGLPEPGFNTIQNLSGSSTLLTFSFDEMMNKVENKKAFWEQIKNL